MDPFLARVFEAHGHDPRHYDVSSRERYGPGAAPNSFLQQHDQQLPSAAGSWSVKTTPRRRTPDDELRFRRGIFPSRKPRAYSAEDDELKRDVRDPVDSKSKFLVQRPKPSIDKLLLAKAASPGSSSAKQQNDVGIGFASQEQLKAARAAANLTSAHGVLDALKLARDEKKWQPRLGPRPGSRLKGVVEQAGAGIGALGGQQQAAKEDPSVINIHSEINNKSNDPTPTSTTMVGEHDAAAAKRVALAAQIASGGGGASMSMAGSRAAAGGGAGEGAAATSFGDTPTAPPGANLFSDAGTHANLQKDLRFYKDQTLSLRKERDQMRVRVQDATRETDVLKTRVDNLEHRLNEKTAAEGKTQLKYEKLKKKWTKYADVILSLHDRTGKICDAVLSGTSSQGASANSTMLVGRSTSGEYVQAQSVGANVGGEDVEVDEADVREAEKIIARDHVANLDSTGSRKGAEGAGDEPLSPAKIVRDVLESVRRERSASLVLSSPPASPIAVADGAASPGGVQFQFVQAGTSKGAPPTGEVHDIIRQAKESAAEEAERASLRESIAAAHAEGTRPWLWLRVRACVATQPPAAAADIYYFFAAGADAEDEEPRAEAAGSQLQLREFE
eukprot:g780.t1